MTSINETLNNVQMYNVYGTMSTEQTGKPWMRPG